MCYDHEQIQIHQRSLRQIVKDYLRRQIIIYFYGLIIWSFERFESLMGKSLSLDSRCWKED